MSVKHVDIIDKWLAYNGPCGLCGYWDQRHRMIGTIRGRVNAGEKLSEIAREYQLTFDVIVAMRFCRIDKRRYKEDIAAWPG